VEVVDALLRNRRESLAYPAYSIDGIKKSVGARKVLLSTKLKNLSTLPSKERDASQNLEVPIREKDNEMEYKTKKVSIIGVTPLQIQQDKDFLCKDCIFMHMEGNGGSAFGVWEWYYMACKKQPTGHGWDSSIDPISDGPDDEVSTSIIFECSDYQKVQS
jgi:hypothetical protein